MYEMQGASPGLTAQAACRPPGPNTREIIRFPGFSRVPGW
jgi:hypothetical protein